MSEKTPEEQARDVARQKYDDASASLESARASLDAAEEAWKRSLRPAAEVLRESVERTANYTL